MKRNTENRETAQSVNPRSESGARRIRERFNSYVRRSREAKRKAASAFREDERPAVERARTVGEILDAFLVAERAKADSRSLREYEGMIENWLRPAWGDVEPTIEALTLVRQERWLRSMPGEQTTRRNRYGLLHTVFEFGRLTGRSGENPCKLPRSALPQRRPRPSFDASKEILSLDEIARLVVCEDIPSQRRVLYLFKATSGARIGELAALQWHDLDLELGRFLIAKTWSRKNARVHLTKDHQERETPIYSTTLQYLREWLAHGWQSYCGREPMPEDLVFAYRMTDGRIVHQIDREALKHFHRDLKALGLPKRRIHALRHSFITNWCAAGADPNVIRAITHPRSISPRGGSFNVYRHFSLEEKRRALEVVRLDLVGARP